MSSINHLVQYLIGLFSLLISNVFYFFYFNATSSVCDQHPFLVTYLQSILYIIVSIMFCIFENSRFKLIKNKKNRLSYSPLSQLEDLDLFELTKPFTKKNACNSEKSFLTDSVFETLSEDDEEDDEQFKLKYQDKLNSYDEYLVKINEKYNEMTKEDVKRQLSKDRKVKFNKKKEIRYLSDVYAQSALLSRLSYEAFMQFNYQLLNHYSNLAFSNSLSIVPSYAVVHFLSIYFTNLAMNYYYFQPVGYFDLNAGISLICIMLVQYFYFNPSFTEKITFTKSIICLISLASLYLIKLSSNQPFIQIVTSSDSIFINQTVLNDSTVIDLFSIKCRSMIYTVLSSFLSALFLASLRNNYEQDDFDIKVFSSFLSGFTLIAFGALLLFVLNQHIAEPVLPCKHDLISILHQGLLGPAFGHFFLVM